MSDPVVVTHAPHAIDLLPDAWVVGRAGGGGRRWGGLQTADAFIASTVF